MGFRFRKSINLGLGFKVNLSKSGIGYSWGVPGYRITKTAKGRTRKTYSIPGTGIGYVEESSNKIKKESPVVNNQKQNLQKTDSGTVYDAKKFSEVEEVETGKLKNFQPAEYKDFLRKINLRIFLKNLSLFLFIGLFIFYFAYQNSSVWIFFGSLISLITFVIIKIFVKVKIEYNFEDDLETNFNDYVDAWKELKTSQRVWQIYRKAKVVDKKNMYGAKQAIERDKLKISFRCPWYLKSNIKVPVLYFKKVTLILLPDKILVVNKFRAGAVNQQNVNMKFYTEGFIESELKPKDSELIQYQWLHSNKQGGPDQRYQSNKQLPVFRYSYVEITSPEGINELIMVTKSKAATYLSEFYDNYIKNLYQ